MSFRKRAAAVSMAALTSLFTADAVLAQCAMCRTTLEQNGEMAAGFNNGILFLLAMPYVVFGSIALGWYLKRRKAGHAQAQAQAQGRHLGGPGPTPVSESSI